MSTKFKFFCVCCGMALAGIVSTAKSYADNDNKPTVAYCDESFDECGRLGNVILLGTYVEIN